MRVAVRAFRGGWAAAAAGVVLAGAVMIGVQGSGASALDATFSLDPASQTVAPGAGPITVTVSINNVTNMASWEFSLMYDPGVLSFTSATADQTMLKPVGAVLCPAPIVDETAGTVLFGCATSAGESAIDKGADGSGKLGTVVFAPKAKGTSPLVFNKIEVADAGAGDIPATGGAGIVRVLGAGEQASGLEPTPTANPSLLIPTRVAGAPTPDPDVTLSGAARSAAPAQTPQSGVSGAAAGAATGGGAETDDSAPGGGGATSGAGTSSGGVAGAAGARGGENFPIAGQGAVQEKRPTWPRPVLAALGGAGALLLLAGARRARRQGRTADKGG